MLIKPTGKRIFKPGGEPARKSEYESYTSLSKYLECPAVYYDYYQLKVRESVSKELIAGRAYHGTLEDALLEKMWKEREMGAAELAERWHQRWLLELFLTREEFEWKGDMSPEDYFKAGGLLVEVWRRDYLPKLEPVAIEEPFWVELSGCKRALFGRLDLVTKDKLVIDHKTSGKPWAIMQHPAIDLQMAIYHAAHQVNHKCWPERVELHRAIFSGEARIETIDLTYTVDQVQEQFDTVIKPTIQAIEKSWESGVFTCNCSSSSKKPKHQGTPNLT